MSFAKEGSDRFCTMGGRVCVKVLHTTTTTTTTTASTLEEGLRICLAAIKSCLADEQFERKCVEEQVPRKKAAPPGVARTNWDVYAGSCCPLLGEAHKETEECLQFHDTPESDPGCKRAWQYWADEVEEEQTF